MRKAIQVVLSFQVLLISMNTFSQNTLHNFGFIRNDNVQVSNIEDKKFDFPWVGGLNSVMFSTLDMNNDNIDDLLIFERNGNKLLPFINIGIEWQFSYIYKPEYNTFFPSGLKDWLVFQDYNHDGKKDLFTYTTGGIKLYKNISENGILKFELVSEQLKSLQFGNYVNIFLTNVDMPIIDDIDEDGDTDILTFGVLGSFVEWHRNMGVELFANSDTLVFERTERCWGDFMESESSNLVSLNINCPWNKIHLKNNKDVEHVGSTMLFFDSNNDGLKDLLLGDTDYANIIELRNGGSQENAHFISQNANFPSNTKAIEIYSLPAISMVDIDNDGIKEMLVSPFDPSYYINESKKSVWFYQNTGTEQNVEFVFKQDNFLQDNMIEHGSGAYPVFFDYNGDGLTDLFVSNYGTRDSSWYDSGYLYSGFHSSIALYENIGTFTQPEFKLITEDFAELSQYNLLSLYPTFGDIDSDGDADMLLGNKNGKIWFFKNNSGTMNQINLSLADSNYFSINVGSFSTPQLFDINKDNMLDILIGNRSGKFSYYKNTGTIQIPVFTHQTDFLGKISTADLSVSYYGHSVPWFYRNQSGKTFLFSGSFSGNILLYDNIDDNLNGTFSLSDTLFTVFNDKKNKIKEGLFTSVTIAELNGDQFPEMIIGNFSGGLGYYEGTHPPPDDVGIHYQVLKDNQVKIFPNPFTDEIFFSIDKSCFSAQIQICDIQGRIMFDKTLYFKDICKIQLDNLPIGLYFIRITAECENSKKIEKYGKIVKIK